MSANLEKTSVGNGLATVVTTIQEPTPSLCLLAARLQSLGGRFFVVGDGKGPARFELPSARFYSVEQQRGLPFRLAEILPEDTYARKNLGYLLAMREGTDCIYETDDDNSPADFWRPRARMVSARSLALQPWINVYQHFSRAQIWPRGMPLTRVSAPPAAELGGGAERSLVDAPIQQGLADVAPDVDALWRLIFARDFCFEQRDSVWLPPGAWCPFNSQNTWWWPQAFPLMYLPSHCSFRMTDTWRSFVAQRCLWEAGLGLVFHAPDVIQQRNDHDLMRDFADELPGYLHNEAFTALLEGTTLTPGRDQTSSNLWECYTVLVREGLFPSQELTLLEAWLADLREFSPA